MGPMLWNWGLIMQVQLHVVEAQSRTALCRESEMGSMRAESRSREGSSDSSLHVGAELREEKESSGFFPSVNGERESTTGVLARTGFNTMRLRVIAMGFEGNVKDVRQLAALNDFSLFLFIFIEIHVDWTFWVWYDDPYKLGVLHN